MTELDRELSTAVAESMKEEAPFPRAVRPQRQSLTDQYAIYEKCGAELRRRLAAERTQIMVDYQRAVALDVEETRQRQMKMKADFEERLRENDLISKNF
jgi:hypothetical protein